jgi:hypothetical protein
MGYRFHKDFCKGKGSNIRRCSSTGATKINETLNVFRQIASSN